MSTRDYIETLSGRKVWLPQCDPASIDPGDIAHALSLIPRFAGHIDHHYSVAEHSIWVSELCMKPNRLQGLFHDGTEAYICDIPTPFKRLMSQYKELENDLAKAIALRIGVPVVLHDEVKYADRVMLLTERDYLKSAVGDPWSDEYESTPRVQGWKPMRMNFGLRRATPAYVRDAFMERYAEYSL